MTDSFNDDNPAENLLAPEKEIDELFERIRRREGTEEDLELYHAAILHRFAARVYAREPVERWIMRAIADSFCKVVYGEDWEQEFPLPGRGPKPIRPWREQRDLEIFCSVSNAVNLEGEKVTEAIKQAASDAAVSYETARAAYYKWRDQLSKNKTKS